MSVNMIDSQTLNLIRLDGGGGGQYVFDDTPTNGSRNPVTSDGIYDAMVAQKSEIETSAASTYATQSGVTQSLASLKTEIEGEVAQGYVTNTSLSTTLEDYPTETELTTTLEDYVTDEELQEAIDDIEPVTQAQAQADFEAVFGSGYNPPSDTTNASSSTFDSSDVSYED